MAACVGLWQALDSSVWISFSVSLAAFSEAPLWTPALFSLKYLSFVVLSFHSTLLGSVISFQSCHLYAHNSTECVSSPGFFPELQTQIANIKVCFQ